MSGVSNLRQVVSTTQAVERVQEAQNRSPQAGQQHFAESLEREAKDNTKKVKKNPDVKRADEREERAARDEDESLESTEDEHDEHDDEEEGEDGERHVDVIA
jgi:hypothetical protein